jgi:hypothetical protein
MANKKYYNSKKSSEDIASRYKNLDNSKKKKIEKYLQSWQKYNKKGYAELRKKNGDVAKAKKYFKRGQLNYKKACLIK